MANSYTLLQNLRAGRCSNTAEVRLLRFWEAKNINKGGELISVDMLLIDENLTVVHGSIPASRQLQFKNRLSEGSTDFEKLPATDSIIPTEHFRFRQDDRIIELANTGNQLPGVIGELCAIRSTITDRIPGAQRVMLTLRLESEGATVCVSMFDYLALAFHNKLDGYGKEPRIVIVTGINPKMVSGVDPDQSGSSSKVVHAQKIEPMTVSELNQFVLTADPQIIEFLCTAKVTEIQLDEGWSYIGCSVCSKKLTREETSFACVPCNETNAVAKLRYRMILSVSDATGAAAFLGFDTEMSKLTHVLTSEAAQIVGIGTIAQVGVVLPRLLADLVGRTYTFQLKLKDFNFTPNHQTFTISRIFPQRELAPNPTFAEEDVEVIEPANPQSAAERSGDKDATTSNVAEQSTVATDAEGTEQAAPVTNRPHHFPLRLCNKLCRLLTRPSSLHEVMVKTPVSDPDKAPVLSTSASSSATKRSRKKKGVTTNAKVARQRRRTIRASMRNKGPQQTIQHSQSTTLSEQSHTINDVDSDRVNKRTARALRMEKLIKKRVATPKKLNVAASGSRPGGRYRRPVVNKWDLVTCPDCKAIVWNAEAVVQETQNSPRRFSICCQQGRVNLPPRRQPPSPLKELLEKSSFKILIRVANGMLAFTSMGGQIDNSVTNTPGPFSFRLHGQTHHRIGSLLPPEGKPPQFSQLYIVDTEHEIANRKKSFNKGTSALAVDDDLVDSLIKMLDEHNPLAKTFRHARDRILSGDTVEFSITLVNQKHRG
ncbi:unnamed protein product [Brassica napus]|uniref:(rape) hypothetical protein n=1 Tax=Brassica napus TaxID=3708 RepID=A0A816KLE0_BRANA|nr:unnamed protein product [Brassica napus]